MYTHALHVYLLIRLGVGPANVHMYYACILTHTAWRWPRLCTHVLCMYTCSYGLALASPMYTCARYVYLLIRLGSDLAYVHMRYVCALTRAAWLRPRRATISHAWVHHVCLGTCLTFIRYHSPSYLSSVAVPWDVACHSGDDGPVAMHLSYHGLIGR